MVSLGVAIVAFILTQNWGILPSTGRQLAALSSLRDPLVLGDNSRVLIGYPTYGVSEATHYFDDGSRTTLTAPAAIMDFMKTRLDLSIDGDINGLANHLGYYSSSTIMLQYKDFMFLYDWEPLFDLVDDDEAAFMHADGLAATRANRILSRVQLEDFMVSYVMDPSSTWVTHFADWVLGLLAADERLDGILMDDTGSSWVTGLTDTDSARFIRWVTESHVSDGSNQITINNGITMHTPAGAYAWANPITVYDNQQGTGTNYFTGGSNTATVITLGTTPPPDVTLYVGYYALAIPAGTDPVSTHLDVTAATVQAFATLQARLGDKLLGFNGIYHDSGDYDLIAGGDLGMDEAFVYATWSALDSSHLSEAGWLAIIDELATISQTKMYLAQSGSICDLATASSAEERQMQQRAMFAFGSFLLGKGPQAYFNFGLQPRTYQRFVYFDYWDEPIGSPAGAYVEGLYGNNVYSREYENALVLANPTAADATLTLDRSLYDGYWNRYGIKQSAVDELTTLGAYEAVVLIKREPVVVVPDEVVAPAAATRGTSGSRRRRISTPELSFSTAVETFFAPLTALFAPGQTGAHVKQLQQMLAQDPTIYNGGDPEGFYGQKTVEAVQKFQIKYGILQSGTPESNGFGMAGPVTRAKLNELYAGATAVAERIAVLRAQLIDLMTQLAQLLAARK